MMVLGRGKALDNRSITKAEENRGIEEDERGKETSNDKEDLHEALRECLGLRHCSALLSLIIGSFYFPLQE